MAYTNNQKKQHILELQTYLHAIALMNDKIPLIIPDGVYDKETALAVRAFQREYGLPETGNTDPETWNRIVSVYRKNLRGQPIPYAVFPSAKYIVRIGDDGQLVYIIQVMLHDMSTCYDNAPDVEICGSFNAQTAEAVKRFQQWSGLPQSGSVDSGTWNMLVHCCEHMNNTLPR
ncbi:peptidoglycan-binding protein [Ruminococcus sp. XPD3002]|uniref:peptidoglycan-binding domain-containing protein n=1 Tax=Ruminococcus sp. XPD3002 TaxID=1452269 RepID=UPI00090FF88D|nr:peptidoglycan-binding protein [Ruminococcus sp.]SFX81910.1 Putative peptidoglycan binding domain-containing protein [Ruminococcus flavefaciens]HRU97773.1 peptidoglycan-binding domain-containing protein [Ruminococcus sp.]